MRKCNNCFKREGVHRWGRWWLCDECHKKRSAELKSKENFVDFRISEESQRDSCGYYHHGRSAAYLSSIEYGLEATIAHEIIHHVLNIFVNPSTSYDYDNVSGEGEVHNELFAVCDEVRKGGE